jgi:hypothetical protein
MVHAVSEQPFTPCTRLWDRFEFSRGERVNPFRTRTQMSLLCMVCEQLIHSIGTTARLVIWAADGIAFQRFARGDSAQKDSGIIYDTRVLKGLI